MDIIKNALETNKLSDSEQKEIRKKARAFIDNLNRSLKKGSIEANAEIGGSAAKGTMVKGDFDCDIFVRFGYSYKDESISDLLEKAISDFEHVERVHGSRDYFQVEDSGINYEIVPVLYIDNPKQAQNVTDMSPLHVKWIEAKIHKKPGLRDEIIIAKVFCKAQDVYGAESYIGGFSGHVLDILIVYYGSFMSLLDNATHWNKYKVIDVEGYNTFDDLNKSKISPLIVIDPVDMNRNAAAALKLEKFSLFKKKAREFIKNPAEDYFKKKKMNLAMLRAKAGKNRLIVLKARPLEGKKDIVGCKIKKVHDYIQRKLREHEFKLMDSGWQWSDDALFWYILPDRLLSDEHIHIGPPLIAAKDAGRFRQKYRDAYTKEGRLYVNLKRQFTDPGDLVRQLVVSLYAKESLSKISIVL